MIEINLDWKEDKSNIEFKTLKNEDVVWRKDRCSWYYLPDKIKFIKK